MQFYLIVLLCNLLTIQKAASEPDDRGVEEEWIEPNAWGRKLGAINPKAAYFDALPSNENCEKTYEGVALVYYKKLITTLFRRDNLQYDNQRDRYCRSLLFDILPKHLDELESASDARELDRILEELLGGMKTTPACMRNDDTARSKSRLNFLQLNWDIAKDLWQIMKISEVQFALVAGLVIFLGWYCHRYYGLGVVVIFLSMTLIIGYVITYLECNKKLEIDRMLEIFESDEPVREWYTPLVSWLGWKDNSRQQAMRNSLKKTHSVKLQFCRPDHVLLLFANDLFMKQLEFLLEKCATSITALGNNMPFPMNYMAAPMLLCMLAYILKLSFKYIISPRAWAALWHARSSQPASINAQQHAAISPSTEDRISGENLKTLLNFITNTAVLNVPAENNTKSQVSCISGVENVFDKLEIPETPANTPDITPTHSNSSSSIELVDKNSVELETLQNGLENDITPDKKTN